MDAFTLHELNEFIKRILAFNLPDEIWVQCELAQVGYSRGNYYIDLIEKDDNGDVIVAQSQAALWKSDYTRLKKKHGSDLEDVLQEGLEVMIKVKVEFHERYGLKLVIKDIDMHYIMGKVEMQRRATIEALQKAGLIHRNNENELPIVLQRIAVLSAEHAAGYQDFRKQLSENQFGYDFYLTLFEVALQGTSTTRTIVESIKEINSDRKNYDCIVIIRGGGSKMDLAAFDDLELNKAIAKAKLPVLTGIGHEIDETVADIVAYSSLKTPTALADFLINKSYNFEAELLGKFDYLKNYTLEKLRSFELRLQHMDTQIRGSVQLKINKDTDQLDHYLHQAIQLAKQKIANENARLPIIEKTLAMASIEATLDRGFTVTQINGRAIKKNEKLKKGDKITTLFQSSKISSTVDTVKMIK